MSKPTVGAGGAITSATAGDAIAGATPAVAGNR